jgi:undecaprenyl-diphosphatase
VKPVFRRARPAVDRGAQVVGVRPLDHSFPSGHSASSFAAATALSMYYPKAAPIAFSLATGVGLSRVHLGVHYPSDAAVGAAVGIGIGTLVGWLIARGPFR